MHRSAKTVTGNAGVLAVRKYCQEHGLIFQAKPEEDYGVDCYVEISEGSTPLSFMVAIQSKSGPSYRREIASRPGKFRIYVDEPHFQYWAIANIPVVFVYLDGDEVLWWKHVQAYLQESAAEERDGTYIEFGESDRADGSLATYLRELQATTPNVSHRLMLVKAREPHILVGEKRFPLSSIGLRGGGVRFSSLDTAEWVAPAADNQYHQWDVSLVPGVVGMSADGRWIGYIMTTEEGGRGCGYDFRLLDREKWAQFDFSILTIEEHTEEVMVPLEQINARLASIRKISERVGLLPVAIIDVDELYPDLEQDRNSLGLDFGGLTFTFAVEGQSSRSYLHLRCDRFVPTRSVRMLAVINNPQAILPEFSEDDGEYLLEAVVKAFDHIRSVFVSCCGRFVSLLIGTNEENLCWGTVDYTFVHLTAEDLRSACLECIGR